MACYAIETLSVWILGRDVTTITIVGSVMG